LASSLPGGGLPSGRRITSCAKRAFKPAGRRSRLVYLKLRDFAMIL
jgi:hypothetical protein